MLCTDPLKGDSLVMGGAIPEIEIDEALVRHPEFSGQVFKVGHSALVEPDGDRLLEPRNVRVLFALHLRKVVGRSHGINSRSSLLLASAPFWRR